MTQETALKHIKTAWIAGLVSAGVTLLVSVLGAAGVAALANLGFGWWSLFDVALLAGLSFGVYRKSRAAAVLLLIYFVIARIFSWASEGSARGVGLALVFGYFYVQGIRGTFAFRAMVQKEASSGPMPATRGRSWLWLYILGGLFSFGCVSLLGLLVYIGTVSPGTEVLPGAQVPQKFMTQIRGLALLDPGEKLLFFYSDALLDLEDGCYLLTDKKVVVYRKEYENPKVIVPISQIKDVDAEWSESFWEDSQIALTLSDDSQIRFPLSSENGGDKAFVDALNKRRESQSQPVSE